MKNSYIIIDDFFSNVDQIRKIALDYDTYEQDSKHTGWKGYRARIKEEHKKDIKKLYDYVYKVKDEFKIQKKIFSYTKTYFHYTLEETKKRVFPSFDISKIHRDDYVNEDGTTSGYAGVVYLSKNSPENSGTRIFLDEKTSIDVKPKYNRMVMYDSNLFHGPIDLFGNNIHNSRLTLTFFVMVNNYINYF